MGLLSEYDLDYYLSQLGAYFAIMLRDNPDDTYKELYSHYCAVREHIQTLEKTNGWISVKDRLPEEDVDVIVSNGLGIEVAAYTTNPTRHWYGMSGNTVYAQYWMPIPEPPKEET